MPSVTVSFAFPNDAGGAAEVAEWSETSDSGGVYTGPFHETGDGNPVACLRIHCGENAASTGFYDNEKTAEAWGVPSGATVTGIKNVTCDCKKTGASYSTHNARFRIAVAGVTRVTALFGGTESSDTGWVTDTPSDSIALTNASTDNIRVRFRILTFTNAGGYVDYEFDNISFDIEYTSGSSTTGTGALASQAATISGSGSVTPPDEIGTGALTAQAATISGTGTVTPPDVIGTGALVAQAAVIAGVGSRIITGDGALASDDAEIDSLGLLTLNTLSAEIAYNGGLYTLAIAGTDYPLFQFSIKRTVDLELAYAYIPIEYEYAIAAADTFLLTRTTPAGTETLYDGTVTTKGIEGSRIRIFCSQTPSYAANVRRDLSVVYYISDSFLGTLLRTYVDARYVPNDQVAVQNRLMTLKTVKFYSNGLNSFMELSDGG